MKFKPTLLSFSILSCLASTFSVYAEDLHEEINGYYRKVIPALGTSAENFFVRTGSSAALKKDHDTVHLLVDYSSGGLFLANMFREVREVRPKVMRDEIVLDNVDLIARKIIIEKNIKKGFTHHGAIGFDSRKYMETDTAKPGSGYHMPPDDTHRVINIGKKGAGVESIEIKASLSTDDKSPIYWAEGADNKEVNFYADTVKMEIKNPSDGKKHEKALMSVYRSNNGTINIDGTKRIELLGNIDIGYSAFRENIVQTKNIVVNINQDRDNNPDVILHGNVSTINLIYLNNDHGNYGDNHWIGNRLNIRMNTPKSEFTGEIWDWSLQGYELGEKDGTHFEATNGAKLNITDGSYIHDLHLADGASVNMMPNTSFKKLHVDNLSGGGGTFTLNIDATKHDKTDYLVITGKHEGTHYIKLRDTGNFTEDVLGTGLVYVKDEQGEFLANDEEGTLYWDKYTLAKRVAEGKKYPYIWYIAEVKKSEKPTSTINSILATHRLNYYLSQAGHQHLHQRLGDVRRNPEKAQGLWVRQYRLSGKTTEPYILSYNSRVSELGYDKLAYQTDKMSGYYGLSFHHIKGNSSNEHGSDNNKGYGASLYYTAMYNNGSYLDLVARLTSLKNKFTGISQKKPFVGELKRQSLSLSAEYGKQIKFKNNITLEPEVQGIFSYFKSAQYQTSNKVVVEQGRMLSLVGRFGARLAKRFHDTSKFYVKFDLFHDFSPNSTVHLREKKDSRSVTESFRETWFEYGLGLTYDAPSNYRFYAEYTKSGRNKFNRGHQFNIGLQHSF